MTSETTALPPLLLLQIGIILLAMLNESLQQYFIAYMQNCYSIAWFKMPAHTKTYEQNKTIKSFKRSTVLLSTVNG